MPNTDGIGLDRWRGDPSFMLSVAKGILVLHAVVNSTPACTISDLAKRVELPRAVVKRCVHTLQLLDYIVIADGKVLAGPRMTALAGTFFSNYPHFSDCEHILNKIRNNTGESTTLWLFDNLDALFVAGVSGKLPFCIPVWRGYRRAPPLYSNSVGRICLASLPQEQLDAYFDNTDLVPITEYTVTSKDALLEILGDVHRNGFTVGDREDDIALRSVAVPIHEQSGRTIGALALGTHPNILDLETLKAIGLPELTSASEALRGLLRPAVESGATDVVQFPPSFSQDVDQWLGDGSFMLSLARGLLVLEAAVPGTASSVSDIAALTGLSRATVRRCIYTCDQLGILRVGGGRISAGPRLAAISLAYLAAAPQLELATPILQRFRNEVGHYTSIWTYRGARPVRLARIDGPVNLVRESMWQTTPPLHSTSVGRLFLSTFSPEKFDEYLAGAEFRALTDLTITDADELRNVIAQTREQGFVIVDQELELGLVALTVPLYNFRRQVVGGLQIGVHNTMTGAKELEQRILPIAREMADSISGLLP